MRYYCIHCRERFKNLGSIIRHLAKKSEILRAIPDLKLEHFWIYIGVDLE